MSFRPDEQQVECVPKLTCDPGTVSRNGGVPANKALDCVELVCAPPWKTSETAETCNACPPNTFGAFPACQPCTPQALQFCAGATMLPSLNLSGLQSGRPDVFGLRGTCPLLSSPKPPTATVAAVGLLTKAKAFVFIGPNEIDLTILVGLSTGLALFLAVLAFASWRVSRKPSLVKAGAANADGLKSIPVPTSRCRGFCDRLASLLIRADTLSTQATRDEKGTLTLKREKDPLGGFVSLIAGLVFITYIAIAGVDFGFNNIARQVSTVFRDADLQNLTDYPITTLAPGQPFLQVRLTVAGDANCSAPIAWSAVGEDAPSWTNTSQSCVAPSSGLAGVWQHIFSCNSAQCTLPVELSLNVSLHYSCQSVILEAAAVDANGVQTQASLPGSATMAIANRTGLGDAAALSSVAFDVIAILSLVNSSVPRISKSRGYRLLPGAFSVLRQSLQVNDSLSAPLAVISPTTSVVSIGLSFSLSSNALVTTINEKTSVIDLIKTLLTLASTFTSAETAMSALGIAHGLAQQLHTLARRVPFLSHILGVLVFLYVQYCHCGHHRIAKGVLTVEPFKAASADVDDTPAAAATRNAPAWEQRSEGADVWFVNRATGESVWTLPDGAVVKPTGVPDALVAAAAAEDREEDEAAPEPAALTAPPPSHEPVAKPILMVVNPLLVGPRSPPQPAPPPRPASPLNAYLARHGAKLPARAPDLIDEINARDI